MTRVPAHLKIGGHMRVHRVPGLDLTEPQKMLARYLRSRGKLRRADVQMLAKSKTWQTWQPWPTPARKLIDKGLAYTQGDILFATDRLKNMVRPHATVGRLTALHTGWDDEWRDPLS